VSKLHHALADVAFVADHWVALVETRIPGTARSWRPPQMTAERREELDRQARAERLERAEIAPGERPTPVHVDVLDLLVDIVGTSDRLGEQVWSAAGRPEAAGPWRLARFFAGTPEHWWAPAPSAYADPRGHLATLADCLALVDDELVEQVAREFRPLVQAVALALRLLLDGQVLDGACPWCRMPRALVVVDTEQLGALIVCRSRVSCEPPERDCGIYLRGRPAWAQYEWDWLAGRIRHADRLGYLGRPVPDSARDASAERLAYEARARELWDPYNTPESMA
jgi:hypothetical protein